MVIVFFFTGSFSFCVPMKDLEDDFYNLVFDLGYILYSYLQLLITLVDLY